MPTNIDGLSVEIKSSVDQAVSGIDALAKSLSALKNAVKIGTGAINSIAGSMKALGVAMGSFSQSNADSLRSTVEALKGLKSIEGIKLSSTIAKGLAEIADATSHISTDAVILLPELAHGLSELSGLGDVKISSTVAKGINEIGKAAGSINGASLSYIADAASAIGLLRDVGDIKLSASIGNQLTAIATAAGQIPENIVEKFGQLATALEPLRSLEGNGNLSSTVSALRKIPEVATALNAVDISQFADNLKRIGEAMRPLATTMDSVGRQFNNFAGDVERASRSTATAATTNRGAIGSYTELSSAVRVLATSLRGIVNVTKGWIEESNQYIEDLNLFNASMGQYAEQAQRYAESVSEALGIDPSVWMRNQGVFQTLTTGFGVAADRAYVMSTNLAQLGYDLSSFFNIAVDGADGAMNKLASGIAGELEPLRRLGYDLSEARLKAIALSLGIDQTYKSMTQAEKAQLRYYAIMTQVTTAHGDMARTLNAPSNQLRVLKAQVTQAAREIGNVFIPVLNSVLPVAIALVKALRMVAQAFASLFGFSLPEVDYSGIEGASTAASDLDKSLSGAGGSAKKLKAYLAGFDELNVMSDNDSSGGGGGGGAAADLESMWDWELPTYNMLDGLVGSRVEALYNNIRPLIEWIQEHAAGLLSTVEAIGAALVSWKIASTFLPSIKESFAALEFLKGGLAATAVITIGAIVHWHLTKQYLDNGETLSLIANGVSSGFTALLAKKIIQTVVTRAGGSVAAASSAGSIVAGASLAINVLTDIVTVYNRTTTQGFDTRAAVTEIMDVVLGATSGALIAAGIGGSVVGGAIAGAVITASAALAVTLVGIAVYEDYKRKKIKWGEREISLDEANQMVSDMFTFDATMKVNVVDNAIVNAQEARKNLHTLMQVFANTVGQMKLGVALDDSDGSITAMLDQIPGIIGAIESALANNGQLAKIGLSFAFGENGSAEEQKNSQDILSLMGIAEESVNRRAQELGSEISKLLERGLTDQLTADEVSVVQQMTKWLSDIETAVASSGVTAEFAVDLGTVIADGITRDSYQNVLDAYKTLYGNMYNDLVEVQREAKIAAEVDLAALNATRQTYVEAGEKVPAEIDAAIAELELKLAEWNIEDSAKKKADSAASAARETIVAGLSGILSGENSNVATGLVEEVWTDIGHAFKTYDGNVDLTEFGAQLNQALYNTISTMVNGDDMQVFISATDVLGITDWDLLGADVQAQLYAMALKTMDSQTVKAAFAAAGWDLGTEVIVNGTILAIKDKGKSVVSTIQKLLSGEYDVSVLVDLVKNGWTNIKQFVENSSFGESVKQGVSLVKSGWTTIQDYVGKNPPPVKQPVEIVKASNWAGKTVEDALGIKPKMIDYTVGLKKSWTGTLTNWVSDTWSGTFKVNLEAGMVNGTAYGSGYRFATGGFPEQGQMFIARESGAELVGSIGRRTAVVNNQQIVEAVSQGVYQAVSAANNNGGGSQQINVYLDGKTVYESVVNHNRQEVARTGASPLLV